MDKFAYIAERCTASSEEIETFFDLLEPMGYYESFTLALAGCLASCGAKPEFVRDFVKMQAGISFHNLVYGDHLPARSIDRYIPQLLHRQRELIGTLAGYAQDIGIE